MVLLPAKHLITIFMTLSTVSLVEADCDRTHRRVGGKCEPCPHCDPGYGLTGDCGHGRGEGVSCAACPVGSYNPPPGGRTCLTCTNCTSFGRQVTFKCRNVIDAACGECLDGFFEREGGLQLNLLLPCTSCTQNPQHPQCHHTRPQVVAPVTIRLQANLQSEEAPLDGHSTRPIALLAVILGTGCLLTLGLLTFFLVRHRRLIRRLRTGSQQDTAVEEDQRVEEEGCTNHSGAFADDTTVWRRKEPAPHRHGAACMTPARQAAPWCPGLTLRPDLNDAKRKRTQQGSPTSSQDDPEAEVNDCSDTDHLLSRKRPKMTGTGSGSGRGSYGRSVETGSMGADTLVKETSMTLTLKPKCDTGTPLTSNNPSCCEQYVFLPENEQYKGEGEDGEDTEGEDEDDGPPPLEEEAMDVGEVEESVHRLEEPRQGTLEDDDDDEDLQQYGACALPPGRHQFPLEAGPMWPYVDFRDLTLSPHQRHRTTSPSGLGDPLGLDLSIDFDRDLEGDTTGTTSRGSSGNVSQASTVLIRGLSDSPPTVFVGDGPMTALESTTRWPSDSMTSADDTNSVLTTIQPRPTHDQSPVLGDRGSAISQVPALAEGPSPSTDTSCVTYNETTYVSVGAPYVGPPPRRLAALANTFTRSRGDLAQSAESETETVPRMLESLDEERYAQALRLARDRLVAELDFDMTERLGASLHPRPLVGDRNFRHLGAALGVPPEVLSGACAFDDLLAHLRRQRVTLVVLLKAVRALGRMDVVFFMSVWVLENFSLPTPGGGTYGAPTQERHLSHLIVPETQGPLSAEIGPSEPTIPVQETGDPLPA